MLLDDKVPEKPISVAFPTSGEKGDRTTKCHIPSRYEPRVQTAWNTREHMEWDWSFHRGPAKTSTNYVWKARPASLQTHNCVPLGVPGVEKKLGLLPVHSSLIDRQRENCRRTEQNSGACGLFNEPMAVQESIRNDNLLDYQCLDNHSTL